MSVWYRPNRELLTDAMKEAVLFPSKEEMIRYVCAFWEARFLPVRPEDLVIGENRGKDPRISWTETRYICAKRLGDTVFDTPQCIGMCSFEDGEFVKKNRVVTVTFEFEPGPIYGEDGKLLDGYDEEYARDIVESAIRGNRSLFVKAELDGVELEDVV